MTGSRQDMDTLNRHAGGPSSSESPRSVWLARWLWIGGVLLGLVRSIVHLSDRHLVMSQLRPALPNVSQEDLDTAVNNFILFTLLIYMGMIGLYVMLANRMARGRDWARIVMTILASMSVVGTASMAVIPGPPMKALDIVFHLVAIVLDAAVVVFLWRPESTRFFRESGANGKVRTHATANPAGR